MLKATSTNESEEGFCCQNQRRRFPLKINFKMYSNGLNERKKKTLHLLFTSSTPIFNRRVDSRIVIGSKGKLENRFYTQRKYWSQRGKRKAAHSLHMELVQMVGWTGLTRDGKQTTFSNSYKSEEAVENHNCLRPESGRKMFNPLVYYVYHVHNLYLYRKISR